MARFDSTGPRKSAGLNSTPPKGSYKEALFFGPNADTLPPEIAKLMAQGHGLTRSDTFRPFRYDDGTEVDIYDQLGNDYASGEVIGLPSGHTAYEVSDWHRQPDISAMGADGMWLNNVMPNSSDLFEAYPELASVPVWPLEEGSDPRLQGYVDMLPDDYPEEGMRGTPYMRLRTDASPKDIRDTVLHETQHLIDLLEGRPVGGGTGGTQEAMLRERMDEATDPEEKRKLEELANYFFNDYQRDQTETLARLVGQRSKMAPGVLTDRNPNLDLDYHPEDVLLSGEHDASILSGVDPMELYDALSKGNR